MKFYSNPIRINEVMEFSIVLLVLQDIFIVESLNVFFLKQYFQNRWLRYLKNYSIDLAKTFTEFFSPLNLMLHVEFFNKNV